MMSPSRARDLKIRRKADGSICDDLCDLNAGEECLLSGHLYTVRDATCTRLITELRELGTLPYDLEGQTLFFAGPTPGIEGQVIGSIGPTTAARMDGATVELMDAGIVATLGKGARSVEVAEACVRCGGVYFAAIGGIAALYAHHVTDVQPVAYDELGTEALMRLTFDEFPVFVALDSSGVDWYRKAPLVSKRSIKEAS